MHYPKIVTKLGDDIEFPAATSIFLDSRKLSLVNATADEQLYALHPKDGAVHRCRSQQQRNSIPCLYHLQRALLHTET